MNVYDDFRGRARDRRRPRHPHAGPEWAWEDAGPGHHHDDCDPDAGRGERRGRARGRRGRGRGEDVEEFFGGPLGPEGPFGPGGPFGPSGPFGPAGPFGPGGPFGGRGRGRGGGRGRARRGEVRSAALLLIAEAPRNGYQIIQELADRTGGAWKPSPGAIYPALSQLEDEGLIAATEADGRKAFRITEAGAEEARAWDDRPKPWDSEDDTEDGRGGDRRHGPATEMLGAMRQVAMASTAVAQSGDDTLVRAATDILDGARRDLYRLLADGRDVRGARQDSDDDGRDEDPQDVAPGR